MRSFILWEVFVCSKWYCNDSVCILSSDSWLCHQRSLVFIDPWVITRMRQDFRPTKKLVMSSTSSFPSCGFASKLCARLSSRAVTHFPHESKSTLRLYHLSTCLKIEIKISGNSNSSELLESAQGQTLHTLSKHLFSIHRGLFLKFMFRCPRVSMLFLFVHFRAAFASVTEHFGNKGIK